MSIDSLYTLKIQLQKFLGGKENTVKTILAALLSKANILLEDSPGIGKTTFVKLLAKSVNLNMKRVQCTSDLLPSDIIGVQTYDQIKNEFTFREGPLFTNILLADELNRTSAKTQSALLEAMAEKTVTVDRETKKLPKPFLVIATQNPSEYKGTFSLPESQLDRFAVKISLGYLEPNKEQEVFKQAILDPIKPEMNKILSLDELLTLQELTEKVYVSDKISEHIYSVVRSSRLHSQIMLGISTRGALQWLRIAKGIALIEKRDFVTPDDLLLVAKNCLLHRIKFKEEVSETILIELLQKMEI